MLFDTFAIIVLACLACVLSALLSAALTHYLHTRATPSERRAIIRHREHMLRARQARERADYYRV